MSSHDSEIQRRCDSILNIPVFSELATWRGTTNYEFSRIDLKKCKISFKSNILMSSKKGYSNSLKGVLSYYHSTIENPSLSSSSSKRASAGSRPLCESEYMFGVPVVYSHHPPLPKNDSPTQRSMAMLVEIYLEFIQTLPSAIVKSLNGHVIAFKNYIKIFKLSSIFNLFYIH